MKPTNLSPIHRPRVILPSDLRAWTDQTTLLRLALQYSAEANIPRARPGNTRKTSRHYPAPMMLALLTYCYATGVYASREIERLTYADETVRYLAVNRHPSGEDIRRFRRPWRDAIKACLASVLNSIWLERFSGIVTTDEHGNQQPHLETDPVTAYPPMANEAENRLNRAVQYDCADWDE
jgi:hypothetical protein